MAQLKNYPLIEQITILPGNNLHFQKKGGQDASIPKQIHETLSHHPPSKKRGEEQQNTQHQIN